MTVWIYTDTSKPEGDVERLKVFSASAMSRFNSPLPNSFPVAVAWAGIVRRLAARPGFTGSIGGKGDQDNPAISVS
jgi:hypothetical protein